MLMHGSISGSDVKFQHKFCAPISIVLAPSPPRVLASDTARNHLETGMEPKTGADSGAICKSGRSPNGADSAQ